ncbi:MAG: hypothetical protein ABI461_12210 [Polyangiaceae bacterium]
MKQLVFSIGIAVAAIVASTGCSSSYNHEEITEVSTGDLSGTVTLQSINIPVGGITVAKVIPYNSDKNPMIGIVTSDHPEILLVEGAEDNKWAFSGVSVGTATIHFMADGAVIATVVAKVSVQGN